MVRPEDIPERLHKSSYDEIFDLMVTQPAPLDWRTTIPPEVSFAGNMPYLIENRPDVFLFTHKSAIPVADSVRAYYEELGIALPELGVINTKEDDMARLIAMLDEMTGGHGLHILPDEVLERELAQLKPTLDGKKVAIIDQWINKYGTINRATWIAEEAGATTVRTPYKANWYHDARIEDIDVDGVTSVHAKFMRRVGHAAARFEVPPTWRILYAHELTATTQIIE